MLSRLSSIPIVLIVLLLPSLPMAGEYTTASICRQCHMKNIEKNLTQTFIHEPFVKKLCTECHLAKESKKLLFSNMDGTNPKQDKTGNHINLQNKEFTSLTICSSCHPDSTGKASHPVNILPGKGMSIPPEYPTLDDGRISCITCHNQHSSNIEYRLIKTREQGFCVGCHRSKKSENSGNKFQCRGKCNKEI